MVKISHPSPNLFTFAHDEGLAGLGSLAGYAFTDPTEQQETEALLNVLVRLPIADAVVMKVIEIRQSRRMKLPDAIIVATALLNNCTVVTRNVSDFSGLDGLVVMNPFEK